VAILCVNAKPILIEVEGRPTQRTSTRIARLEPLEQAARVEHVLASLTALRRQLLVSTDDRVADCTLALPFERSSDILSPRSETIADATILFHR
jgi:hypothetical protein